MIHNAIFIGGLFFWFFLICFTIVVIGMLIATRKDWHGSQVDGEEDGAYSSK
jgi:hypothetical protein